MTDLDRHEAHEVDRVTRGRELTRDEVDCYIADKQTPIRHGTARVGDEIAEQLRDELAAIERQSITERLEAIVRDLEKTTDPELHRAAAVVDAALVLVNVWAARVA